MHYDVAGLPSAVLVGSWYCKSCVQENDAAAAATLAEAEAAAKAARLLSKKGKSKGATDSGQPFCASHNNCRNKTQAVEVLYWWSRFLRIDFVVFSFVMFCDNVSALK